MEIGFTGVGGLGFNGADWVEVESDFWLFWTSISFCEAGNAETSGFDWGRGINWLFTEMTGGVLRFGAWTVGGEWLSVTKQVLGETSKVLNHLHTSYNMSK